MMKRILASLGLVAFLAAPAQASCYADYKAKRDNPLQLHYGVIELADQFCGAPADASAEIAGRIGRDGWLLLNVLSIFNESGLGQRKDSAGEYFLRY